MTDAGDAVAFRSATVDDVTAVLELWLRAGAHPTRTDNVAALTVLLARDPDALIVAEQHGRIVGSVIGAWNGWRGSLYRVAVDPALRRRGIGTELVRRAIANLRSRGVRRVDALVVAGDDDAVAFWDRLVHLGVVPDSPKLRYIVDPAGGPVDPPA